MAKDARGACVRMGMVMVFYGASARASALGHLLLGRLSQAGRVGHQQRLRVVQPALAQHLDQAVALLSCHYGKHNVIRHRWCRLRASDALSMHARR